MKRRNFKSHGTISKGSRLGVGSLIRDRAFDGLKAVSGVPRPFYLQTVECCKAPLNGSVLISKMPALRIESINIAHDHALAFERGEEKAFDFFFRQLFPSLCFFANHILDDRREAEDIASSAFIKIWKRHSQFNDSNSIRSYLYQIVRNDCLKFLQQRERTLKMQKEIKYLTPGLTKDNCESDIIRAEFFGALYKALNSLPRECRKVFRMLYIDGKKVSEIAEELKISASTVKSQKARGLALLKQKFINTTLIFFLILFSIFFFSI